MFFLLLEHFSTPLPFLLFYFLSINVISSWRSFLVSKHKLCPLILSFALYYAFRHSPEFVIMYLLVRFLVLMTIPR